MKEKVLHWIREEELIEAGSHVIAGVSGGADSVCLLLLLKELREVLDFSLEAVHVEHGIRGDESAEDAAFVEELCKGQEIPCTVYRVDVPGFADRRKIGLEEAARILRYRCYEQAAGEHLKGGQDVRIALAHHAQDNAETMLFQLVRGSGIDGLCGMRPKRKMSDGVLLIRPLLSVERGEIEAYLEKIGQESRKDATNEDTSYSRNRIRHEVLPALCKINGQAVCHMNQSAAEMQEISDYITRQADKILPLVMQKTIDGEGNLVFLSDRLLEYPKILRREVIYHAISLAAGSSKDIGRIHVESLERLFGLQTGRRICLPYRLAAERVYEGIRIVQCERKESVKKQADFCYSITEEQFRRLKAGETVAVETAGIRICFKIQIFSGELEKIIKNKYTKWLDYDKIKDGLQIRRRQSGDYLICDDAGHRKKLKDYFVSEKFPREQRETLLLLAEGSHILWVIGGRISAYYKVTADTKRILEVTMAEDSEIHGYS